MIHAFDVADAKKHGLNAAIIANQFRGWIAHNKANIRNRKDGRTWTYNSVKAWGALFPYLTLKQIRTAIELLLAEGVLIKGNFNDNQYDRTCWYALADEAICLVGQIEVPDAANEIAPPGKSLDQSIKPYKVPTDRALALEYAPESNASRESQAEAIYQAYPRKIARDAALKAIRKALAKVPSGKLLTATLSYAAATSRWPEEDKHFVPYAATWFNRGSYDDDPKNWQRVYDHPNQKPSSRSLGDNSNLAALAEYEKRLAAQG